MRIDKVKLADLNEGLLADHNREFNFLAETLTKNHIKVEQVIDKLRNLQIAIPSWALGTGGTRFGRFPGKGEPGSLEEKIEDIGLMHALNQSSGAISLHIPWDIPKDTAAIKGLADELNIKFDAMNSNTFQDQESQKGSYKFGSLCHTSKDVRDEAIAHNKEVIDYGIELGSDAITVWLADGSNFPGQQNLKRAYERTLDSLTQIYAHMPAQWKLLLEYKPFEPNFYSTVVPDWGTSYSMVSEMGEKAYTLVDLGHHLPNTNIEQIVAILMMKGKLGGFHFNDSKYADDDITVGSIKPYQLFLIFNELTEVMESNLWKRNPVPAWMIDASHNTKDPLEDLLQSVEAIKIAYAQSLIIDRESLWIAQEENDAVAAQEILQNAFRTDVRPLLAEARNQSGGSIDPLWAYRNLEVRKELEKERGSKVRSTGL